MHATTPGTFGGSRNPFTGLRGPDYEFNASSKKQCDVKFVEKAGRRYVRFPSILKWSEGNFGEVLCVATLFTWKGIGYRICFRGSTLFDGVRIDAFKKTFADRFLPGQQLFVTVLLCDIPLFGEARGPFSDLGTVIHVYAHSLSSRDGEFVMPIMRWNDVHIRCVMAVRGDSEGTVFEGCDQETDELCILLLPLQNCARLRRDVRVRNGAPFYKLNKGEHVCTSHLSMLPVVGASVPCPYWLRDVFPELPSHNSILIDYSVYGGWHYAFAMVVGFKDCAQDPNMELMEVSVDDILFTMHYGVPQIYQHKRTQSEREQLSGTICLLYLHRTLPGWGQPPYAARLWMDGSLKSFHELRDGRSSLTEYPAPSTTPIPTQYYYDFEGGIADCDLSGSQIIKYEQLDLDLDGLHLEVESGFTPKSCFARYDDSERCGGAKTLIGSNDLGIMEVQDGNAILVSELVACPGHSYPKMPVWRDRELAEIGSAFDPRWLMWFDCTEHTSERLRKIVRLATHCLFHERALLTTGFRLRIDWSNLFLRLNLQQNEPTLETIRETVHAAVKAVANLLSEKKPTEGREMLDQSQPENATEDFSEKERRIIERIRSAEPRHFGFWPCARHLSRVEVATLIEL